MTAVATGGQPDGLQRLTQPDRHPSPGFHKLRHPLRKHLALTESIVCGLLLLPFVEPPTRGWTGGSILSGDWRPTLLALGLLAGYAVLLTIPPLRAFFELTALNGRSYLLIGLAALAWAVVLRFTWRARLFERYLRLDWTET